MGTSNHQEKSRVHAIPSINAVPCKRAGWHNQKWSNILNGFIGKLFHIEMLFFVSVCAPVPVPDYVQKFDLMKGIFRARARARTRARQEQGR